MSYMDKALGTTILLDLYLDLDILTMKYIVRVTISLEGRRDILQVDGSKVTSRFVIEKDIDENRMFYVSYTKGYKPGGSNLTYGREDVVAPIVVLPTFEEEVVDAYEFGLKADIQVEELE